MLKLLLQIISFFLDRIKKKDKTKDEFRKALGNGDLSGASDILRDKLHKIRNSKR